MTRAQQLQSGFLCRTLTETISTDTIYAMSTCMFLLSLAFHDYGVDAPMYVLFSLFIHDIIKKKRVKFIIAILWL